MAFGTGTISAFGGAVSDILGGQASAEGLRIKAESLGMDADALRLKAKGDIAEAENYDLASTLAGRNKTYLAESTNIQRLQTERQVYASIGSTAADVGGAGFALSGNALDIMRDSAQQGAIASAVLTQQQLIGEEAYDVQQKSYSTLAEFSRYSSDVNNQMAGKTDSIADQTRDLADTTEKNAWYTGAIKGAAGIASLFI